MKSLESGFLQKIKLTQEHAATLNAIAEYKGKQELYTRQTPEVLDSLKTVAIVESSESLSQSILTRRIPFAPDVKLESVLLLDQPPTETWRFQVPYGS